MVTLLRPKTLNHIAARIGYLEVCESSAAFVGLFSGRLQLHRSRKQSAQNGCPIKFAPGGPEQLPRLAHQPRRSDPDPLLKGGVTLPQPGFISPGSVRVTKTIHRSVDWYPRSPMARSRSSIPPMSTMLMVRDPRVRRESTPFAFHTWRCVSFCMRFSLLCPDLHGETVDACCLWSLSFQPSSTCFVVKQKQHVNTTHDLIKHTNRWRAWLYVSFGAYS